MSPQSSGLSTVLRGSTASPSSRLDTATVVYQKERTVNSLRAKPLTIKKLRKYPKSARAVELPPPSSEGFAEVGASRDGPLRLHYSLFGQGPIRIMWLCGHGDTSKSWTRYVHQFGIKNSDIYTSLLVDHRGTGQSEGPWSIWTMKTLAADCVELLDYLGWTKEEHSVNLVGHSMGGMVAQEIGVLRPKILRSMFLIATTSHWLGDFDFGNGLKTTLSAIIPKSADARLANVKRNFFGETWINQPDEMSVFPTNGDCWAANSYIDAEISYRGAIMQAPGCVRHRVSRQDLKRVAETVENAGGGIVVLHGLTDRIIPYSAATKLMQGLTGDVEGKNSASIRLVAYEDTGHLITVERYHEIVKLIEGETARTSTAKV